MMYFRNFNDMPVILKLITGFGLLAPALTILTIVTGGLGVVGEQPPQGYGFADNYMELILVLVLTIPIFLSSFFMLRVSSASRYWYAFGWASFFLSPVAFESNRADIQIFLIGAAFNLSLGGVIVGYLFLGRQAVKYFHPSFGKSN